MILYNISQMEAFCSQSHPSHVSPPPPHLPSYKFSHTIAIPASGPLHLLSLSVWMAFPLQVDICVTYMLHLYQVSVVCEAFLHNLCKIAASQLLRYFPAPLPSFI